MSDVAYAPGDRVYFIGNGTTGAKVVVQVLSFEQTGYSQLALTTAAEDLSVPEEEVLWIIEPGEDEALEAWRQLLGTAPMAVFAKASELEPISG